ncbi:MAG: PAS domain-containing protein, partial [Planctomycetota bacterium]|nr:PAS domain-containing protein [Planctomycetota bacterium]
MDQHRPWRTLAFSGLADPVIVESKDGTMLDCNAEAERLYGWRREELVGKHYETLVPPSYHHTARKLRREGWSGDVVRGGQCSRCSRS